MTTKIDQPIIGYKSKSDESLEAKPSLPEQIKRPDLLSGYILRIRAGGFNIYMTIGYCPETNRPMELFFSSSHLDCAEWVAIATRLSSMILKSYDHHINNLNALATEYCETVSPKEIHGKVWGEKKPRFFKGLMPLIGYNLKALHDAMSSGDLSILKEATDMDAPILPETPAQNPCPECQEEMQLMDGCYTCPACGWSKCA